MVDGTYAVVVRTPLGARKAEVTFKGTGTTCTAELTAKGKTRNAEGTLEGDTFRFEGEAVTTLGKISYVAEGTADGSILTGTVRTKKDTLHVTGKRI